MVGSSFVSEDELGRYCEAGFQEFLGILGSRYDEVLLRYAKVTAFAGEETVQLGAQCPRGPAGWTFDQTTQGSRALGQPDGTATCTTALHTHQDGLISVPLTNMTFGATAPLVTVEIELAMGQGTPSDQFLYLEVGAPDSDAFSSGADYRAWVNLDSLAIGTVGAAVNLSATELSTQGSFRDQWRKVRLTFTPPGPRLRLRLKYVGSDGSTAADTTNTLLIGDIRTLQATPLKKLRGVRIEGGRFLRRGQLRDYEAYNLTGQSSTPEPERYILRADNGNESMPELILMPTPSGNVTLCYYFVPVFTLEDVGMMSLVAGWDEYVVLTAAMKMKDKEESDVSVLVAEREMLKTRMVEDLEPIDTSEPAAVQRFQGTVVDPYSQVFQEDVF